MKRFATTIISCKGFTLIEVIVTILAAAIFGYIFVHFMGTAMHSSYKSIVLVAGEAEAEGTMERIIADYVREINSDPENALGTIMDTGSGGYGDNVTMKHIKFDQSGNELDAVAGDSDIVKISVQAPGHDLTTIITKSRDADRPPIKF